MGMPSQANPNDGTMEELRRREVPPLSIQYHAEASPGPLDSMFLFDRYLRMVADGMEGLPQHRED